MRETGPFDPLLIFDAGGTSYAVAAGCVRETIALPRLTALEDTPPWVLGGFELYGDLVPLVGIPASLGRPMPAARVDDRAIIIRDGSTTKLALHARRLLAMVAPGRSTARMPADGAHPFLGGWRLDPDGTAAALLEAALIPLTDTPTAQAGGERAEWRLAQFEQDLDRGARRRLDRRARHVADAPETAPESQRMCCLRVRIQRHRLALMGARCAGFLPIGTRAGGAPGSLPGIVKTPLGRVLGLRDPRPALGIDAARPWRPDFAVILRGTREPCALAVDAVEQLLGTTAAPMPYARPAPDHSVARWLSGTVQDDDDILPVVDPLGLLGDTGQQPAADDASASRAKFRRPESQPDLVDRDDH
jgi:chemotaxis signal transduction protein